MTADPSRLRRVPCEVSTVVRVKSALVHQCPHVDEVDVGSVAITWACGDTTIELHSLSDYLASWQGEKISHEEITHRIRQDLQMVDGIEVRSVETTWTTAGMSVHVSS